MVSHVGPFLEHFCLNGGAFLVKFYGVFGQIVGVGAFLVERGKGYILTLAWAYIITFAFLAWACIITFAFLTWAYIITFAFLAWAYIITFAFLT